MREEQRFGNLEETQSGVVGRAVLEVMALFYSSKKGEALT